jgi:hypothetical protein
MAGDLEISLDESPLNRIRNRAFECLDIIEDYLERAAIDPSFSLRLSEEGSVCETVDRTVRLGVYPVNGNPMHWGHLLCALGAIATHKLDRVVVVIQGIDARKHHMSIATERHRHEMARRIIAGFQPLLAYSSIGRGTKCTGEQNIFRLLRLNPEQPIHAFYMAGSDHCRIVDDRGRPDTPLRLERNLEDDRLAFDPDVHSLTVIFIDRGEGPDEEIPTELPTDFVPQILDASSSDVRDGRIALTPHENLRYIRNNPEYAHQIGLVDLEVDESNGA